MVANNVSPDGPDGETVKEVRVTTPGMAARRANARTLGVGTRDGRIGVLGADQTEGRGAIRAKGVARRPRMPLLR